MDGVCTEPAGQYTFFYRKGHENHELATGSFVHKRIILAVKRVEFVSDRMSYIIARGRWCNVIVLNVHATRENKTDDIKDRLYEELQYVFITIPKQRMKILLGHFHAEAGREDILKQIIGNESLQEINNNNGVRVVNFVTSKYLFCQKYDVLTMESHSQIDHILIDRRRHSKHFMSGRSGQQTVILTTIWW
jgi:hypothetical protein